jgi:hypothetical protein
MEEAMLQDNQRRPGCRSQAGSLVEWLVPSSEGAMFPAHLSFHSSVTFPFVQDIMIALTMQGEGGMFTPPVILHRLT